MLREVEVPEGVDVSMEGDTLKVKGKEGELERKISRKVNLSLKDGKIELKSISDRRKDKAVLGTTQAHLQNMVLGVTRGFRARLRVVHSHFPMKVQSKGNEVEIQNFIGENKPRTAKVEEGVEVKLKKDDIILTGTDKEKVGQTAANIERATKITGRDRRVYQDGIYITQKPKPAEEGEE